MEGRNHCWVAEVFKGCGSTNAVNVPNKRFPGEEALLVVRRKAVRTPLLKLATRVLVTTLECVAHFSASAHFSS